MTIVIKNLVPSDKYNGICIPLIQSPLAQTKQSGALLFVFVKLYLVFYILYLFFVLIVVFGSHLVLGIVYLIFGQYFVPEIMHTVFGLHFVFGMVYLVFGKLYLTFVMLFFITQSKVAQTK